MLARLRTVGIVLPHTDGDQQTRSWSRGKRFSSPLVGSLPLMGNISGTGIVVVLLTLLV